MPKIYTANSIKAMHEKLNLDAETVMLLYDYFDAFSNFYEMLPLIGIISRLNNITRAPFNRGFTPVELNQLGRGLSADSIVYEEDGALPLNVIS